ncbi:MAG: nucleotidyltransferase domain-containing protein [Treponema sp.]|nr:nucleotidyltransferase domain-containing protein [Treponema sp.]
MAAEPVQTKTETITALQNLFSSRQDLHLLVLHGSAAADRIRDDSDIDVALALDSPLTGEQKLDLMFAISQACGREADVADLRTMGGLFLHQVLSKGSLVINRDPGLYSKLVFESIEYIQDIHPIVMEAQKQRIKDFINGR